MKELYWIGVLQGDSRVAVVAYGANRTAKEQAGVKGKEGEEEETVSGIFSFLPSHSTTSKHSLQATR